MCLKDLRDEFIYDCECRHLAKGSVRNYKAATRFLLEYLELKQITELEDVRPRHIRDLMKEKQDAGSTSRYINDLLKVWRTWFNYLVNEGYLEERDNPAKKVKCLRQPRTIIDTFTVAEMKRMIQFYDGKDFLEVRNKTIIMLLFDTGMRCNEMILMEPEDIKQDYILVKHGKGSKERVVPKSPALSKQLVKYCTLRDGYLKEHPTRYKNLFPSKNGKPMTDEAVARILKHAAKEVGVSSSVRVSPHTCRHTFAQMQLKNGLDLYSVSRLMGHAVHADDPHFLGAPDDGTALGTYPPPGAALCFGGLGSSGLTAAGCFAACSGACHIRPCQPFTHLDVLPTLEDDKVQQLLGRARDGPAVLFVVVDGQAVCLGLLLKAPVVVDPVVAGVLDAGLHAVLVHHLVQQGGCGLLDGAVKGSR